MGKLNTVSIHNRRASTVRSAKNNQIMMTGGWVRKGGELEATAPVRDDGKAPRVDPDPCAVERKYPLPLH